MTPRQRVAAALRREEADRVPWCEIHVDRALARQLMGWGEPGDQAYSMETHPYTADESRALADHLGLDSLSFVLRAPVYAHKHPGLDGRLFYGDGMLRERGDLHLLDLPDPHDDALYADAAAFLEKKGDYSAWFITRAGIFPTTLSMGLEAFSFALFEDRGFVEEVLDRYFEWSLVVAERVCAMGFDVYVSTDDMAFGSGPFFSPEVFRDLVLPRYRRLAEIVDLPWIMHSDGNMLPLLDDLVELGIAGLHPNEKGAMDIRATKAAYGDRLCLLGNVDLNILGMGTTSDVEAEVRGLIRDVGPGGGYIVSSGNSLAGYLKPDNVMALSATVRDCGAYPINLS